MGSFTSTDVFDIRHAITQIINKAIVAIEEETGADSSASSDSEESKGNDYLGNHNNLKSETICEEPSLGPFNLEWCFGFNYQIPIIYLSHDLIAFAAAHVPIIYNTADNCMKPLIGHQNWISSMANSRNMLATGDCGSFEPIIIIWDFEKGLPLYSWIPSSPEGTSLLAFDSLSEHLVSISGNVAERWSLSSDHKITHTLPLQTTKHLTGHPFDYQLFVVTYPTKLFIINFVNDQNANSKESSRPSCSMKLGNFTLSLFGEDTIFTGTEKGQIIVWTMSAQYLKTVQTNKSKIIKFKRHNNKLLISHENGEIGLYAMDLKLEHWFQTNEPCLSISFSPEVSSTINDYIITTLKGRILTVAGRSILDETPAPIVSLDMRPNSSFFASGDAEGNICVYDIERKKLEIRRQVFVGKVTALTFSLDGWLLAVGSEWGDILILEPILLNTVVALPTAKTSIGKFCFSADGRSLAYYQASMTVELVKKSVNWVQRGKHSSHSLPITDMAIGLRRLFTIAEDRMVAEYDIKHSLRYIGRYRIEQSAKPVFCKWHRNLLLVANDECKIRLIDPESQAIIGTVQGPCSGPIRAMVHMKDEMVYAAGNCIGVCDPVTFQCTPQIQACPSNITHLAVLGSRVITSSKTDNSIFTWTLNEPLPAKEEPKFSDYVDAQIKHIFEFGPIIVNELIDKMRFLGFFPSDFEVENILREVHTPDITKEEFRTLFWNYKPLHTLTINQIRNALLCVSTTGDGGELSVSGEKLIKAFETGLEPLQTDEILESLNLLHEPMQVTQELPLTDFMQNILGIDPSLIES